MITENVAALCEKISLDLRNLTYGDPTQSLGHASFEQEAEVKAVVQKHCAGLDAYTRTRIYDEYFGAGPLEGLLEDKGITEILINGRDSIWFEKGGKLQPWEDKFLSPLTYRNFVQRVCKTAEVIPTLDCPFSDGQWNGFRLHLSIPPAVKEATIALRRHPESPWTFDLLLAGGWGDERSVT